MIDQMSQTTAEVLKRVIINRKGKESSYQNYHGNDTKTADDWTECQPCMIRTRQQ